MMVHVVYLFLSQAVYNVICYNDQTRLKTAFELLNATIDIEKQVGKVSFLHISASLNLLPHLVGYYYTLNILTWNEQSVITAKLNQFIVMQVSSPLLILHGAEDKVTDPSVSQFLYEKASSTDKTLKLYEEGYHCILEGEPDDRIFTVISDIISWLDARC